MTETEDTRLEPEPESVPHTVPSVQGGTTPGPPSTPPVFTAQQAQADSANAGAPVLVPALVGQWIAFSQVMRSRPLDALRTAEGLKGFWPFTMVLVALFSGLLLATVVGRSVQIASGIAANVMSAVPYVGYYAGSYAQDIALPASVWFGLFFYGAIAAAASFVLRAVAVKLVFRLRGQNQPFGASASLLAAASTGQALVSAVLFLLILIPVNALTQFTLVLGALAGFVWFGISELLIYVGINRRARLDKSPLVPHVLLSTGVVLVLALLHGIALSSIVDSVINSF